MATSNHIKLGSLFDGSGGFPLAASMCGIEPVWASEVEPYPIAVTKSRFPNMKHLGSVTDVNGAEVEPVDIITFGSPCQDLSVAGKRAGLKHEANGDNETTRSGLFIEAVRIIKEMREATNGEYPTFALWENVPGAFSSNKGEDFRTVLEELIKIVEPKAVMPAVPPSGWAYADSYVGNGWSLAYRVFDAQYWGVPQRRRRIHLVVDFRGERAGEVLFEREGVRGYFATGRTPWQRAAGDAADCAGADDCEGEGNCLTPWDVQSRRIFSADGPWPALYGGEGGGHGYACIPCTLKIRSGCEGGGKGPLIQTDKSATLSCNNDQTLFRPCSWDGGQISPTLTKQNAGGGQRMPDKDNFNCALQPFGICSKDSNAIKSSNPHSGIYEADTSRTIDTSGGNPACNQGGIAVVCVDQGGGKSSCNVFNGLAPTLTCTHGGEPVVAFAQNQRDEVRDLGEKSACLSAEPGMKQQTYVLQGSMIGRADRNGPQGSGVNEDVSFTLNTIDRHAVYAMTTGSFTQVAEDKASTVLTRDYKDPTAVCYGIGRDTFNQGKNAKFAPTFEEELQPTLVAKGPGAIQSGYTVRRLTPTECARLQGFPDDWGHPDPKDDFTDEEYRFWLDVRNTHAAINGKVVKEYTEHQMLTWYNKLHTDSAEYKMWGNGIALPPALYCMQGIASALMEQELGGNQ